MEIQYTIGTYDFVRYLGKGGMAAVWEARHRHLNYGRLAVKFLLDEYAGNQDLQHRFLAEAKIQYELHHPNIVRVKDFFEVDGRSYMVMEYVDPPHREGDLDDLYAPPLNLEVRLQDSAGLMMNEIYRLSLDVLSALHAAHEHDFQVVHRDVKPSNIMLSRDGRAMLTDFGIAKLLNDGDNSKTRSTVGTPDYMSPEQITDPHKIDRRSDIYGFGCVLYAMLNGNPPFAGQATTDYHIKSCHVHTAPPPLVSSHLKITPALREVVFKCLEKEQSKRFQTCLEISHALTVAIHPPAPLPVAKSAPTRVEPSPLPVLARPSVAIDTSRNGIMPVTPPPAIARKTGSKVTWGMGIAAAVIVLGILGYFLINKGSSAPAASTTPLTIIGPTTQRIDGPTPSPSSSTPSDPTAVVPSVLKTKPPGAIKTAPLPAQVNPEDCCETANTAACKAARQKAGLPACSFKHNNE